jgi:hypothetical protein
MQETLADLTWTELLFGIAYLAVGSRGARTVDEYLPASGPEWHGKDRGRNGIPTKYAR